MFVDLSQKAAATTKPENIEDDEKTIIGQLPTIMSLPEETKSLVVTSAQKTLTQIKPEITKIKPAQADHKNIKRQALFLIVIACAFVLLFFYIDEKSSDTEGKPQLLTPKKVEGEQLSESQQKTELQKAIQLYTEDTYESLWESQKKSIYIIERAENNKDARGILCLAYWKLWPYVRQNSKDINAIQNATKNAKNIDPIGINGVYCESAFLLSQGKYLDAKGIIDHTLNQPGLSNSPVLYSLKAEILASEKDFKTASLYSEKASEYWPEWVYPLFQTGYYAYQSDQVEKSLQYSYTDRRS